MLRRLLTATAAGLAGLCVCVAGCSRSHDAPDANGNAPAAYDPTRAPYPDAGSHTAEDLARLDAEFEAMCDGYDEQTGATQIMAAALKTLLASGKPVVVLDTREPAEFAVGHLPGAINVPPSAIDETPAVANAPADATIVAYCTAGLRSGHAACKLAKRINREVLNLHGGIVSWFNAGGELETADGQPTETLHPYGEAWGRHVHAR